MFNWDDMRYILHVTKTGSYSGAAKVLKVNHTTVARRIAAVEKVTGTKLFTQTTKGFVLTEVGQEIISDIESLHETSNRISRKIQGKDQSLSGTVNITMPHDIYRYFLCDTVVQLKRDYPDIVLNISLSNSLHNLSTRESDLAVRFTTAPPEDLVGQKIAQLQHAIYGDLDAAIDKNGSVGVVVWSDELGIPEWAAMNFKQCHVALSVDDLEGMCTAVSSGLGMALMPCYLPKKLDGAEIAFFKPYMLDTMNWGLWVLNHVDVRSSKKVQVIRRAIVNALTEQKNYFL